MLVPVEKATQKINLSYKEINNSMHSLRAQTKSDLISVCEMIEEGDLE